MRHILLAALLTAAFAAPARAQLPPMSAPPGNPITPDKVLLGKTLFWDEQLSSTRTTACGTCHEPRFGMSDGRHLTLGNASKHPGRDGVYGTADDKVASRGGVNANASGYQPDPLFDLQPVVGTRRAPSTINAGFALSLFWDGRVESDVFPDPITGQTVLTSGAQLENLCVQPPLNDREMAHAGRTWTDVVARIQNSEPLALSPQLSADLATWINGRGYAQLYADAFGTPQITAARTVMAIATYMRTLHSDQTRFDASQTGGPPLTAQEQQGFTLFFQARCFICHPPPMFSDFAFHDTGVRPGVEDLGRQDHTGLPGDRRMFRTPSLRNVELRAPFFHNGGKQTLEEVVDFYIAGGDFPPANPELLPLPFLTTADRDAIVAFLKTLTDDRVRNEVAPFDRPALAANTKAPTLIGTASPSGGTAPRMIAFEPPAAGHPEFTLAVDRGPAGAQGHLGMSPSFLPTGIPLFGATIHVDPSHPAAIFLATGPLQGTGPQGGWDTVSFPIPAATMLVGVTFHFQWFVLDQSSIAATRVAQFQIY